MPYDTAAGPAGPAEPAEPAVPDRPVVLDRRTGPHGEVVLRRHGALLQIIANGTFLMDTSDGRSERLLVRAALDALDASDGPAHRRAAPHLLIGGLGVGFSLAEAAAGGRWGRITVVEREAAVIDWHRPGGPLSGLTAAALADPRTRVVHADLVAYVHAAGGDGVGAPVDVMALDIDNGPDWTVTDDNASLYSPAGLAACAAMITPGGVLAVWSARPSRTFEDRLAEAGFVRVRTEEVRVVRGVPDVVHFGTKPA